MKTKKFSKKLALNKKTIVHLDNEETKKVLGGTGLCTTKVTYRQGSCNTVCYTINPDDPSVFICCAPYHCV